MKFISRMTLMILVAFVFAELETDEVKLERPERIRMPNLKELWKTNESVQRVTAKTYITDIANGDSDQVWLLLFAKTSLDTHSIRAKQIYDELAPEFPSVKFGFVDINRDELLKVTFDVESIPWTFCIFGGRAYRLNHLEQARILTEMLEDLDQWKSVDVQFDAPSTIASNTQLYMYYIRKDYKRAFNSVLRVYVDVTGATELPNKYLVWAVVTLVVYGLSKCSIALARKCCCKRQIESEKQKSL